MLLALRSLLLLTWGCVGWIVALLLLPYCKPAGRPWWHRGVLWVPVSRLVPSWAIGQCWGFVILHTRKPSALFIHHEDRHSTHWAVFGPIFGLLFFLVPYVLAWAFAGFSYRDNWFERDARDYAEKALVDSAIQS